MKDQQYSRQDNAELDLLRGFFAWLLVPLALFPLVALLTYDWRSMPALNVPPTPSANLIGALGDTFAYWGYAIFGLAVWVVPVVCVVAAVCRARGKRFGSFLVRIGWLFTFLVSVSSILQTVSGSGAIAAAMRSVNIPDAGGAIGHLLMTRLLSPLLSDFGSAVLMVVIMAASLVGVVGLRAVLSPFVALVKWAVPLRREGLNENGDDADSEAEAIRIATRQAREEAKRQKEEEKARIRAEKLAAKEERRAAKEAAKLAAREAAAKEEKPFGPMSFFKPAPPQGKSAGATKKNESAEVEPGSKGPYVLPSVSLLSPLKKSTADHGDVNEMSQRLLDTLKIFGIDAELAYTIQGPVVTKYALRLAPGIRYSAVTNIEKNLMGALHARSLRIEAPIPGEENIGVEVPNKTPAGISFREIIESPAWQGFRGELPLLFGKDAAGRELVADLAAMPHMLVAGATGQGKSVCLNSIINGLLMTKTPKELKLIMVDPKSVEFTPYASLPHLIVPVITDNKKVVFSLQWAVAEMEKRLKTFARAHVRNICDYNARPHFKQTDLFADDSAESNAEPEKMPYIVIIIDEVADLMATSAKEVVPDISRLTAKARAAGIHLILATQRPDAKVITGTIKANIPGRVAFKTATSIDSRTILDDTGAESLIGRGDMLFKTKDGALVRAQGAWMSDEDIAAVVQFIEEHSTLQFDEKFKTKLDTIREEEVDLFADKDEIAAEQKAAAEEHRAQVKADAAADDFKKAVECIINTRRASVSHFQRQLGWGYNRAAKALDVLTERGIVSEPQGIGPRKIVLPQDDIIAIFNEQGGSSAEPPAEELDTVAPPEEELND